ncbi:hypothetical protein M0D69_27595, partial [Caballeronia sp. SEWSISQ10-4 2]|uniref:hypothetical protein n=1 Tax=Caballeronia sp. SEWSISQ10-4 2 TaxID=2937438 RepID=UPI0026559DF7
WRAVHLRPEGRGLSRNLIKPMTARPLRVISAFRISYVLTRKDGASDAEISMTASNGSCASSL